MCNVAACNFDNGACTKTSDAATKSSSDETVIYGGTAGGILAIILFAILFNRSRYNLDDDDTISDESKKHVPHKLAVAAKEGRFKGFEAPDWDAVPTAWNALGGAHAEQKKAPKKSAANPLFKLESTETPTLPGGDDGYLSVSAANTAENTYEYEMPELNSTVSIEGKKVPNSDATYEYEAPIQMKSGDNVHYTVPVEQEGEYMTPVSLLTPSLGSRLSLKRLSDTAKNDSKGTQSLNMGRANTNPVYDGSAEDEAMYGATNAVVW